MSWVSAKKIFSHKISIQIVSLIVLLLVLIFFSRYPMAVNRFYSIGVYRWLSSIQQVLFSWLPFSLGDLLYIAIISGMLYTGFRMCRAVLRKQWLLLVKRLAQTLVAVLCFINAFYLLWGLNYFRPPASVLLNLPYKPYTLTELKSVTQLLIDSTNHQRQHLSQLNIRVNSSQVYAEAVKAIKQLQSRNRVFMSFKPVVKPSLFTPVINYMVTAGYYNPFSGEAQINYAMPVVNRPVTACHEMAHQMGFGREDEANFVGYLAGTQSNNGLLKYSAYYMATQEMMYQLRRQDSTLFKDFKSRLLPAVLADMKAESRYWKHYQNQLGELSSLFYDNFLKVNNQPEGLQTYNRMVNLTMAYYRQKGNLSQ
jgi:hypothetical protein